MGCEPQSRETAEPQRTQSSREILKEWRKETGDRRPGTEAEGDSP